MCNNYRRELKTYRSHGSTHYTVVGRNTGNQPITTLTPTSSLAPVMDGEIKTEKYKIMKIYINGSYQPMLFYFYTLQSLYNAMFGVNMNGLCYE